MRCFTPQRVIGSVATAYYRFETDCCREAFLAVFGSFTAALYTASRCTDNCKLDCVQQHCSGDSMGDESGDALWGYSASSSECRSSSPCQIASRESSDTGSAICYICLSGEGSRGDALSIVCGCTSRPVHASCLARWQLFNAGRAEEKRCRFCAQPLPDWRPHLLPPGSVPAAPPSSPTAAGTSAAAAAPALMRINYGGRSYRLPVEPGPEGAAKFQLDVRALLGLDAGVVFDVVFHCRLPAPPGSKSGEALCCGTRVGVNRLRATVCSYECTCMTAAGLLLLWMFAPSATKIA